MKRKHPLPVDPEEPYRLAEAIKALGLRYVVITSVTRDDLPDGGSSHFARCVRVIREELPGVRVEVLIPDFRGRREALERVLAEGPDVLNHNIETVRRLYPEVRIGSSYDRSLRLLKESKEIAPQIPTKSALIVGFGESMEEIFEAMEDLRGVDCDFLTVGQYYQPSLKHHHVVKFYMEEEFELIRERALHLGFKFVACGPQVRSSYRAFEGWLLSQSS